MNTVEPIRDINLVWDIADHLKETSERNYVMFLCGIYTGLRISDILKLQVRDVRKKQYVAIREKKKVFVTTQRSRERGTELSPYRIAASKEELHCYLLAAQGGACFPMRLSRIISVVLLDAEAVFGEAQEEIFARMLAYGPQFHYTKNEEEAVVQFTAYGLEMYRNMYVHRPVPVSVNNNTYTFACSHQQLFQYLVRFGKDAYVVRPAALRERIRTFFRLAENACRNAERHAAATQRHLRP